MIRKECKPLESIAQRVFVREKYPTASSNCAIDESEEKPKRKSSKSSAYEKADHYGDDLRPNVGNLVIPLKRLRDFDRDKVKQIRDYYRSMFLRKFKGSRDRNKNKSGGESESDNWEFMYALVTDNESKKARRIVRKYRFSAVDLQVLSNLACHLRPIDAEEDAAFSASDILKASDWFTDVVEDADASHISFTQKLCEDVLRRCVQNANGADKPSKFITVTALTYLVRYFVLSECTFSENGKCVSYDETSREGEETPGKIASAKATLKLSKFGIDRIISCNEIRKEERKAVRTRLANTEISGSWLKLFTSGLQLGLTGTLTLDDFQKNRSSKKRKDASSDSASSVLDEFFGSLEVDEEEEDNQSKEEQDETEEKEQSEEDDDAQRERERKKQKRSQRHDRDTDNLRDDADEKEEKRRVPSDTVVTDAKERKEVEREREVDREKEEEEETSDLTVPSEEVGDGGNDVTQNQQENEGAGPKDNAPLPPDVF
jgi:hypothetical protein